MSRHIERARVLIEQRRWDLAEGELRQALALDGQDATAHRLLAWCLIVRERLDEAQSEAQSAVHLDPEEAEGHYVLAWVYYTRNRYVEARAAIDESIRLDARSASAFHLRGRIQLERRDWPGALAAAEQGLEIDPDDDHCTNLRAVALVKLGRRSEAGRTIDAALARNPEDPLTHANQGWTLLHSGQTGQAMIHFREALRLDPTQEWARAGIVEALKARHFVYRWLLRYFLWTSRLSSGAQWGLMIGGLVGYNVLGSIGRKNPALQPLVTPLLIAYFVFFLLTWLGSPLFNLLLFLNRFGRLALSPLQRAGALTVGGLLLAGVLVLAAGRWLENPLAPISAAATAYLAIPASAIFVCSAGWPRWTMLGATVGLALYAWYPLVAGQLMLSGAMGIEPFRAAMRRWWDYATPLMLGSQFLAIWLARVVPKR